MILQNTFCDVCGKNMVTQDECHSCYGEDPDGMPIFCPDCEYCCGC